jgi:cysteine desulfurase
VIYADHAATTPPSPAVVEAMARAARESWGNASSVHAAGRRARALVEDARAAVAAALGAEDPRDLVLTSGGTEAVVTAISGAVIEPAGAHVVATSVEHPAAARAVEALARRGAAVTIVRVDAQGRLDPAAVVAALRPETRLVTLQWANHETGVLHPVDAIARECRARGVLVHADAVAAFGKVVVQAGVADLTSVSAHKVYGPQGAGALHVARSVSLAPLFAGGQERGRRGGTEDVPAIAGFGVACRELVAEGVEARASRLAAMGARLEANLVDLGGCINGGEVARVPGVVNASFPGTAADLLVVAMDLGGVAISAGAACSSGRPGPSPVLSAMFPDDLARAASSVRFSLGSSNDDLQIDAILKVTREAVQRLRAAPSVPSGPVT